MCHLGRSGLLIWSMGQACGVDLAVSVALVVGEAVSLQFVWRSSCGGDVLVRESSTGTRGISGGFECSALKYPPFGPAITGVYAFMGFLGSMPFLKADLASIEPLLRGSSGGPKVAFRPVCLGFEPIWDLERRSGTRVTSTS
jgi:hypothetical protein